MRGKPSAVKTLLLLVLLIAALVRIAHYAQMRDSAVYHFEMWTETDMSFYRAWSADIRGGNLLGDPPPRALHWTQREIARAAYSFAGDPRPFSDDLAREAWSSWLGEREFSMDPLYPYLLAAVEATVGTSVGAVLILQGLLGLGVTAAVFRLGTVLFNLRTGFVAGMAAAFYGPLLFFEGLLLRPVLVSLLTLAAAVAGMRACSRPDSPGGWLLAGLLVGTSMLAFSGNALVAAGFLLLPFLGHADVPDHAGKTDAGPRPVPMPVRRKRAAAVSAAVVLAGIVLAALPVGMRNLAVAAPVWSVAGTGTVNFVWHNLPTGESAEDRSRIDAAGRIMHDSGGRFLQAARLTLATGGGTTGLASRLARKTLGFWHGHERTNNMSFEYALSFGMLVRRVGIRFLLVVPLAFAGIVLCRERWRKAVPLLLVVASAWFLCAVFAPYARVRLPAELALIPFAAHGLLRGISLAVRREARSLVPVALATVAGLTLAVLPSEPRPVSIRDADYGVGNLIALELSRRYERAGDVDRARRIVESHIGTEPEALRAIWAEDGESRLSARDASLARHFVALHERAAVLSRLSGDGDAAQRHDRQAERLAGVARLAVEESQRPPGR